MSGFQWSIQLFSYDQSCFDTVSDGDDDDDDDDDVGGGVMVMMRMMVMMMVMVTTLIVMMCHFLYVCFAVLYISTQKTSRR